MEDDVVRTLCSLFTMAAMALAMLVITMQADVVSAAPMEQRCETKTWNYNPGKTPEGLSATATDGCYTYEWTSNTVDVTGKGEVKFRTVGNVQPWESGYNLPGPENGNMCEYRVVHEANMMFTNGFNVPVGTEVTVSYRCY